MENLGYKLAGICAFASAGLSYALNHSIFWAVVHGIFSTVYLGWKLGTLVLVQVLGGAQ